MNHFSGPAVLRYLVYLSNAALTRLRKQTAFDGYTRILFESKLPNRLTLMGV